MHLRPPPPPFPPPRQKADAAAERDATAAREREMMDMGMDDGDFTSEDERYREIDSKDFGGKGGSEIRGRLPPPGFGRNFFVESEEVILGSSFGTCLSASRLFRGS